ncbi:MAG: M56 family metallopeptidase [Planctomycetota bacterium]
MSPLARLAEAWLGWMEPLVVQVAVLAAGLWLLDGILQRVRAWPQLRLALWLLLFVKLLMPPWLASPVAWLPGLGGLVVPQVSQWPPGLDVLQAPTLNWLLLPALWLLGVAVVGVLSWRTSLRRRRELLAAAEPAPIRMQKALQEAAAQLGLRRLPELLLSAAAPGPLVFGVRRPRVVLPLQAVHPTHAWRLPHLLLHELAHVRRGDLLVAELLGLLRTLFWFHPAVWLAERRVAALRELCCDASVAAVLRERTDEYRAVLLDEARLRLLAPDRAARGVLGISLPGLGWRSGQAGLLARLAALQGRPWRHVRLRQLSCALASGLLCACLLPMGPEAGAAVLGHDRSANQRAGASLSAEARELALAQHVLSAGLSGAEQPGCLAMRAAALRLSAARPRPAHP